MSYMKKEIWTIRPKETYKIIRNCSKCGSKKIYTSTGNFRVNANGNSLDVWLIYQCEKCKNTLNLAIYERINPYKIPREQYEGFLSNDKSLASQHALNKEIFIKNHAEIDMEKLEYELVWFPDKGLSYDNIIQVEIKNPYSLQLRLDKIIAKELLLSRTQVKKCMESGRIYSLENLEINKSLAADGFEFVIEIEISNPNIAVTDTAAELGS